MSKVTKILNILIANSENAYGRDNKTEYNIFLWYIMVDLTRDLPHPIFFCSVQKVCVAGGGGEAGNKAIITLWLLLKISPHY